MLVEFELAPEQFKPLVWAGERELHLQAELVLELTKQLLVLGRVAHRRRDERPLVRVRIHGSLRERRVVLAANLGEQTLQRAAQAPRRIISDSGGARHHLLAPIFDGPHHLRHLAGGRAFGTRHEELRVQLAHLDALCLDPATQITHLALEARRRH